MSTTPGDRLRQARTAAGFASAAEAARACGFHPQNLRDHEAGRRGISPAHATAYARAFGRSATWLLYGDGGSGLGATAPIIGRVGPEGRVAPASGGVGEGGEAPLPPGADGPLEALVVEGAALWPAYAGGDTLYVGAASEDLDDVRARLVGRECLVRLMDGEDLVRRLDAGAAPGRFTLTAHKGPPLRDVEIWRAAPIVWVRKAGI